MKMKKFIAVLVTVGMVAALAAGCGSGGDGSERYMLIKEQRQEVRPVTGILPMISRLYPEKMDQEQEELS